MRGSIALSSPIHARVIAAPRRIYFSLSLRSSMRDSVTDSDVFPRASATDTRATLLFTLKASSRGFAFILSRAIAAASLTPLSLSCRDLVRGSTALSSLILPRAIAALSRISLALWKSTLHRGTTALLSPISPSSIAAVRHINLSESISIRGSTALSLPILTRAAIANIRLS